MLLKKYLCTEAKILDLPILREIQTSKKYFSIIATDNFRFSHLVPYEKKFQAACRVFTGYNVMNICIYLVCLATTEMQSSG